MMKKIFLMACLMCVAGLVVTGAMIADAQTTANQSKMREFRIERSMSKEAVACLECHKIESPGIFSDWANSRHANANITCIDCHKAEEFDLDVSKEHYKQYQRADQKYGIPEYKVPVAAPVTPKDCSRCHPDEAKQYSLSKHANTLEIIWKVDPWLNKGMNSDNERTTGCLHCHGTILKMTDGKLDPLTWPSVGVGRINLDGSRGACTSCHTRHLFSLMEARKPEACGQCHLGPDHPHIEIFMESKHGDIYTAHKDKYNWEAAPGTWTAGIDYRAPTCAACHMSGSGSVMTSHDVTERISWETQAPYTVRPQDFKPFPAKTNWQVERDKMKVICKQCHSQSWVDNHYVHLDRAVEEYNEVYIKPAKKVLDELYEKGLIDKKQIFDEKPELDYYYLWHHEGRRARQGVAMFAPDYAWWHGFYDMKERYNDFMELSRDLLKHNKKAYKAPDYPNATGDTTKPPEVAPISR
jgi:nitrate/TMAO reductase-like tetraheme cytochrome c subunit